MSMQHDSRTSEIKLHQSSSTNRNMHKGSHMDSLTNNVANSSNRYHRPMRQFVVFLLAALIAIGFLPSLCNFAFAVEDPTTNDPPNTKPPGGGVPTDPTNPGGGGDPADPEPGENCPGKPIAPPCAEPNNPDEVTCPVEEDPDDPTDDGSNGSCSGSGPGGATSTGDPVILYHGIVTEVVPDSRMPGPTLMETWQHIRRYNSRSQAQSGQGLSGINGLFWEVDDLGSWIKEDGQGGYEYINNAVSESTNKDDPDNDDECIETIVEYPEHDPPMTCIYRPYSILRCNEEPKCCWYYCSEWLGRKDRWDTYGSGLLCWRGYWGDGEYCLAVYNPCGPRCFNTDTGEEVYDGTIINMEDVYGSEVNFTFDENEPGGRINIVKTRNDADETNYYTEYGFTDVSPNEGRIQFITVKMFVSGGTDVPISGAAYVYGDGVTEDGDNGTTGDLLLVHSFVDLGAAGFSTAQDVMNPTKVLIDGNASFGNSGELDGCKLVLLDGDNIGQIREIDSHTDNSITVKSTDPFDSNITASISYFVVRGPIRTTHYRYYDGTGAGGAHQLKMVFDPAAVERLVADGGAGFEAVNLLGEMDSDTVGSTSNSVEDYCSRSFTYYMSNLETDNGAVTTSWGGSDDLEDMYVAMPEGQTSADLDETGFVKTETINHSCGGCGGSSGGGITREYFYMVRDHGEDPTADKVTRIAVEDITDANGNPMKRNVYGLNRFAVSLRQATITDPASPEYWCASSLVHTDFTRRNSAYERRTAAAHTEVDSSSEIKEFFYPCGTTESSSNDSRTVNSSSGIIYLTDYDSDGKVDSARIKKGSAGTPIYTAAFIYGGGESTDTNEPSHKPQKVRQFRKEETSIDTQTPNYVELDYDYTFYDSSDPTVGCTQTKTVTITYPAVDSSENGSGTSTTEKRYYDDKGRMRWIQDAEGHVTYLSYHPKTGGVAYTMDDVETDDLPSEITSPPNGQWEAWSGTVPFTHTDNDSLQLVTKSTYDDLGRRTSWTDPAGVVTYNVFLPDEKRVYRAWDSSNDKPLLPISVIKRNYGSRNTQGYTVDPDGVTGFQDPPDGTEVFDQDDYLSWVRYNRDMHGTVESVDRYHDIPSEATGDGSLDTNYYKTVYRYDYAGRKTHIITVVSGSASNSRVEQVTKFEFDELGRVSKVYRGVSDASHDMGSDYSSDPTSTLKLVAAIHFDEATVGSGTSGVGDGRVTSTWSYFDTGANDYTYSRIYYDWRGNLRGVTKGKYTGNPVSSFLVRDYNNAGKFVAGAYFSEEPTWEDILGSTEYDPTYAWDTLTDRLALYSELVDINGNVYRTKKWEIYQATGGGHTAGDKGNALVDDYYYDRNSRIVAVTSPGQMAIEIAYDGVGRAVESRYLTELNSTKYFGVDGLFNYCLPTPGATAGGDEGVLQMARSTFDNVGNVLAKYNYEKNHYDTNGLKLDSDPEDYIKDATYFWYDGAHRRTAVANYGTGDNTNDQWAYNASLDPRPETAPDQGGEALVAEFTYSKGKIQKVTDPKGYESVLTFDDLGRPKIVGEDQGGANERTTLVEYDGLSNVTKQIADLATDQITTYTFANSYNASLVTKVKYPDGDDTNNNVLLEYYLNGQLKKRKAQLISGENRTEIELVYDDLRRPIQQLVNDAGGMDDSILAITLDFDDLGRAQYITSHSSNTPSGYSYAVNQIKYEYSDAGALVREYQDHEDSVSPSAASVQYTLDETATSGVYDNGLRLDAVTYPDGRDVGYSYGASGEINDLISRVNTIQITSGVAAGYLYNGTDRIVGEELSWDGSVADLFYLDPDAPSSGIYPGFDRFGRIVKHAYWDEYEDEFFEVYDYAYDDNSNRLYRDTEATGKDEQYTYDRLNRLTAFFRGTLDGNDAIPKANRSRGQEWTLSPTGNWDEFKIDANGDDAYTGTTGEEVDQDRAHNTVNEIDAITQLANQIAWADPAYDVRGNMTTVPMPSDLTDTYTCIYDAWNRLVEVKDGETTIAKYEYDGLNRRIEKQYDSDGSGGIDLYRHFYYNTNWQIIETRQTDDPNFTHHPEGLDPEYQYIWSLRYIDAPICRVKDDTDDGDCDDVLDDHNFYLTDANMNVTALAGTYAAVYERYTYDPYGKVEIYDASWNSRASSSFDNSILFAGYYRDVESDIYSVRFRNYHPDLGRWLQRDPLGYVDGMSFYEYVSSNPVMYLDPLGLAITPQDMLDVLALMDEVIAACKGKDGGVDYAVKLVGLKFDLLAKHKELNNALNAMKNNLEEVAYGIKKAINAYENLDDAAKTAGGALDILGKYVGKELGAELLGKIPDLGKFSSVLSKIASGAELASAAMSKDPIKFVLSAGSMLPAVGSFMEFYGGAYSATKSFIDTLWGAEKVKSHLREMASKCIHNNCLDMEYVWGNISGFFPK